MATLGYTKTLKDYCEQRGKKYDKEYSEMTVKEYLNVQMDDYLKNVCWESLEKIIKTDWEKSTSYQIALHVELPSMEWFCDEYDYPCTTIDDWRRNDDEISATFKRLMRRQARMLQNWSVSSRYNPIISKMLLNVNHWYKEVAVSEVKHSWEISDFKELTNDELLAKKASLKKAAKLEVENKPWLPEENQ